MSVNTNMPKSEGEHFSQAVFFCVQMNAPSSNTSLYNEVNNKRNCLKNVVPLFHE